MRLVRTKAFQSMGASAHLPRYEECIPRGVGGKTEAGDKGAGAEDAHTRFQEYVTCLIRVAAITGYHPLGTARIGQPSDPNAVVTPDLR